MHFIIIIKNMPNNLSGDPFDSTWNLNAEVEIVSPREISLNLTNILKKNHAQRVKICGAGLVSNKRFECFTLAPLRLEWVMRTGVRWFWSKALNATRAEYAESAEKSYSIILWVYALPVISAFSSEHSEQAWVALKTCFTQSRKDAKKVKIGTIGLSL